MLKRSLSRLTLLLLLSASTIAEQPQSSVGKTPEDQTDVMQSTGAPTPLNTVRVLRAVLCKSLLQRQPEAPITSASVGDVVIGWNQLESNTGDGEIKHRWLNDGKIVADVELQIKGKRYRTWSRKTLNAPGEWTWQILDHTKTVLAETKFTVQ